MGQDSSYQHVSEPQREGPIIFYDGVCALCNGFVRFVLRFERRPLFKFAPLQSTVAEELLTPRGVDLQNLRTVVLLNADGSIAERSDAVLSIATHLRRPWSIFASLRFIPPVLRDSAYRLVASLRYKLFGKYEQCPLTPPELRERFLG